MEDRREPGSFLASEIALAFALAFAGDGFNGRLLGLFRLLRLRLTPFLIGVNLICVSLGGSPTSGKVKATNRSFNYPIPANLHLTQAKSVVVYCRTFNVTITSALLESG